MVGHQGGAEGKVVNWSLEPPTIFDHLLERPSLKLLDRETGLPRFVHGQSTGGEAAQEKVQQPLASRSVVEDIARQRRLRRFVDEVAQARDCGGTSGEEKRVNGRIPRR